MGSRVTRTQCYSKIDSRICLAIPIIMERAPASSALFMAATSSLVGKEPYREPGKSLNFSLSPYCTSSGFGGAWFMGSVFKQSSPFKDWRKEMRVFKNNMSGLLLFGLTYHQLVSTRCFVLVNCRVWFLCSVLKLIMLIEGKWIARRDGSYHCVIILFTSWPRLRCGRLLSSGLHIKILNFVRTAAWWILTIISWENSNDLPSCFPYQDSEPVSRIVPFQSLWLLSFGLREHLRVGGGGRISWTLEKIW